MIFHTLFDYFLDVYASISHALDNENTRIEQSDEDEAIFLNVFVVGLVSSPINELKKEDGLTIF